MSDILHHASFELEHAHIMDFDTYRSICNSVDRFRKTGIQDKSAYEAALNDPSTVFADLYGQRVPLYADIGHEKMYDKTRCRQLLNADEVVLQCLTGGLEIDKVELPLDTGVIWEEFELRDNENLPDAQPFYLDNLTEPVYFLHPQIADPEHSAAWMASYGLDFSPNVSSSSEKELSLRDVLRSAWETRRSMQGLDRLPGSDANGTFMFFSDDIASNDRIIDDLWKISESGFGNVLGAHHPVSMEFNRMFFDQMIMADNSVTAAHYVDGQPVCFGFIGLDMRNNDWLDVDSTDMRDQIARSQNEGREHVHFYELISDGEKGMGLSMNILDAFLDIAARSGRSYSVFFESTNLSSLYIPEIIRKKIESLPSIHLDRDIEMIDRLHYRGAKVK